MHGLHSTTGRMRSAAGCSHDHLRKTFARKSSSMSTTHVYSLVECQAPCYEGGRGVGGPRVIRTLTPSPPKYVAMGCHPQGCMLTDFSVSAVSSHFCPFCSR